MDFTLSEIQKTFQKTAYEFAEHEIAPYAAEWDEENFSPVDTLKKAAALGFAGLCVEEKWGGSALSRLDAALIFTELATACPATAAWLSIHNMVASLINQYASNDFKNKWLPSLCDMKLLASYCLTEPNAGSDAASLTTSAVRQGDDYIINGTKAFISGGSVSDIYLCMVRTGELGPKGITCLLVEKNTPGLTFGKKEKKLGWHCQPTTMVFFENCRVPIKNRVGEEGQGFHIAVNALNGGRINIAACSLGGATTCLDLARKHLHERKQFGKKLAEFEALQFRFADMFTQLEMSRLMIYRAAHALDQKDPSAPLWCAMAKRVATDHGFNICNEALQLFGGYGYICDYPIERFFRDLRVHTILEGTNEIMRLIIAKHTL
ncbi:MAG: acyl-CoA dehydrogenase family protein [Gammaproteobacteria bacterium]|nr:acyl-CoA dehydrogenase family protein [Gammaproteobacteria bacterium]